jgi:hypothetical protein
MSEPGSGSFDIEPLYRRANEGDPTAQRDLAVRLHNGDGVAQDPSAAGLWLQKAAEGGDAWAQTQYAIQLRQTRQPEDERASVEWLKRDAAQRDPRAHFTLGLHQHLGIGTTVDIESSAVSMTMAALGGFEDAKSQLARLATALPDTVWNAVFDRVQWAYLTFIIGPLVDGHLERLTTYRQHKDGTDDSVWLRYETETAEGLFKKTEPGSILDTLFDCAVCAKDVHVTRVIVQDQTLAAVTISMRDIVDASGRPVCFMPSREALDAVTAVLALIMARKWVRWSYTSF